MLSASSLSSFTGRSEVTLMVLLSKEFRDATFRLKDPLGADVETWVALCTAEAMRIVTDPSVLPGEVFAYSYWVSHTICDIVHDNAGGLREERRQQILLDLDSRLQLLRNQTLRLVVARERSGP